jgi:enoyl-CoA hydratase/carnithine racemase
LMLRVEADDRDGQLGRRVSAHGGTAVRRVVAPEGRQATPTSTWAWWRGRRCRHPPLLIGPQLTKELLLTGRLVTGREASEMNRLVRTRPISRSAAFDLASSRSPTTRCGLPSQS